MGFLFKSRSQARNFASEHGGSVKDRGRVYGDERWAVVGASVDIQKSPEVSFEASETVAITSQFFASRGEARSFAKTVSKATIIDHAKTPDGRDIHEQAVKDLGKRGQRWEVVFPSADLHITATVTQLPEPEEIAIEMVIADEEDQSIYKGIADRYHAEVAQKKDPVVIMTPGNVCISMPDGTQHTINRDNDIFPDVGLLLIEGDIEGAIAMIEAGKEAVTAQVVDLGPDLKLLDGVLYWHGIKQESAISGRIIKDIEEGTFDNRYVEFMKKLMLNPSYKAVEMLYSWLETNGFEILENGNIKAYKGVSMTDDGPRDWATKKVPNWEGTVVTMPRNMVEDDPTKTCSQGLHVASKDYASGYGTLMEVAVDPADVVSVPYEYQNSKCRVCRYEILSGKPKPAGAPDVLVIGAQGAILDQIFFEEETKED